MAEERASKSALAFAELVKTVRELRERCPWDRQQTIASLSRHLVEEAYEALDAIERDDLRNLAGELGDLIVQVLFEAVLAEERKLFSLEQMLEAARAKLIRRHPHVYGEAKAATAEEVVAKWEEIKREERAGAGATSALEGVARGLPALMRAEKLGQRARGAGMDWANVGEVLAKVKEELEEAEDAVARGDTEAAAAEIGDMLLALANAPRFIGKNAEETLRRACDKFIARFAEVERLAAARKLDLKQLTPSQIEDLWHTAKGRTRAED